MMSDLIKSVAGELAPGNLVVHGGRVCKVLAVYHIPVSSIRKDTRGVSLKLQPASGGSWYLALMATDEVLYFGRPDESP